MAGIRWARRGTEPEFPYKAGRGLPYEIGIDHPLLIPTAGDARPTWTLDDFIRAVRRGQAGRIAVLQFHGVPDRAHPWVHTDPGKFRAFMEYLKDHDYTVIALRDLEKYVPAGSEPNDPEMVIRDRKERIADGRPLYEFRRPDTPEALRTWFRIMRRHALTPAEMVAATGLSEQDVKRFADAVGRSADSNRAARRVEVLPYPGGRHPRLGFRDGAIRPQRETKISVFLPWDRSSYVVLDVPEAIWMGEGKHRELLYLAHTHVPTHWDRAGVVLSRREWEHADDGGWIMSRTFPSGVSFGTRVRTRPDAVRIAMWLKNGSSETLTGLRVQCCAMLARAAGFTEQGNDNKLFRSPYAAVHDTSGKRWIIFAWKPAVRAWGNTRVPCLHSDPQFPDCPPGATQRIEGRLSFYEGEDIDAELKRIEEHGW